MNATEEVPILSSPEDDLMLRLMAARDEAAILRLAPLASCLVGSGEEAALRVADPTLSARHCTVRHAGSHVEVVDLGSRNGLVLGGSRVDALRVGPGATISLGRATLEVLRATEIGEEHLAAEPLPGMIGRSGPMLRVAMLVRRFAPLRLPVLVRGETGSGKELVARAVHDLSGRAGPFVAVNGAAISPTLAESELFGHRRGAFTGAHAGRLGAFREAHGGTLFVDEVAALPVDLQAKLLRAVEEGRVRPLGGEGGVEVDVRIVAATCEPIEELVERGGFRGDLFERLAVCVVRLPSLRERRGDIPALARALLDRLGFPGAEIAPDGLRAIESLPLKGNVRELRNILAQAAVSAGASLRIDERHVRQALADRSGRRRITVDEALACYEAAGRNMTLAARRWGLPRTTMRDLVKRARAAVRTCPSP